MAVIGAEEDDNKALVYVKRNEKKRVKKSE